MVTPNERLARTLRETHDETQMRAGLQLWPTLESCSWESFMSSLYDDLTLLLPGALKLSLMHRWQERFLWLRVVESSPQGRGLLHTAATAELVSEAFSLATTYRLFPLLQKQRALWESDTLVFLDWASMFDERCRQEGWIPRARLEDYLRQFLTDQFSAWSAPRVAELDVLPKRIVLQGFSSFSPAQEELLECLRALQVKIEQRTLRADPSLEQAWLRVEVASAEEELVSCAHWAHRHLRTPVSGKGMVHRFPKIGIVVPDLSTRRQQVQRVFDEILQPSTVLLEGSEKSRLYDLSLGESLASYPLVKDALSLLCLHAEPLPLAKFSVLFHSSFLKASESEACSRALLHARLLRDSVYRIRLQRIAYLAGRTGDEHSGAPEYASPVLGEIVRSLMDFQSERGRDRALPSAWGELWSQLLLALGWPGERALNSSEYQTKERFSELLSSLGVLDPVYGLVDRSTALQAVLRMAQETVFQPKLADGPVRVLGLLEAAGLPFDHLWVCGMHSGEWPSPPRPNPYLPASLSKNLQLPHSSAERELEFAERLTQELLSGVTQGVISSARTEGDRELRPSRLFANLPLAALESVLGGEVHQSVAESIFESAELETLWERLAPAVDLTQRTRGGTSLFKFQAACPFRAFASLRLLARPLEQPEEGLNSAQRGELLHLCLEHFWLAVRSSRNWAQSNPQERKGFVERAVQQAVEKVAKQRPDVLRGGYLELERQRLAALLEEWLSLDTSRRPFEVLATEQDFEFEFAGLSLAATIDRIDRTEDGELILIDYKTGKSSHRNWLFDRFTEPQLPLYGAVWTEAVAGLVFAWVRAGEMAFDGLTCRSELLPGVKSSVESRDFDSDWETCLEAWSALLTSLAEDFAKGRSEVQPVDRNKTCNHCRLETLCRIDELEQHRGELRR